MAANTFVPLSRYLVSNLFDDVEIPDDFLEQLGVTDSRVEVVEDILDEQDITETFYDEDAGAEVEATWTEATIDRKINVSFTVASLHELAVRVPGIDGLQLVIGSTEVEGASPITAVMTLHDDGGVSFGAGVRFSLRFDRDILKPMRRTGDEDAAFEEDTSVERVEIEIGEVSLSYGTDGFRFDAGAGFEIGRPVMIGDTGVIIDELTDLSLNLTGSGLRPEGAADDWRGLYIGAASVYLPELMDGHIAAEGLGIGSGGFYGRIAYEDGDIEGRVLGMEGSISTIALEFVQSVPTEAAIGATVTLPFFDEPVEVEIGIDFDGGFSLTLGGEDGLYTFTRENLLEMKLDSLGVEYEEGVAVFKLSGEVTPLFGHMDWPTFKLDELSIDTDGNVKYEGGWIDLPDQYSLDFHGFQIELTQLGFGQSDDGGRWIGFSGALNLVEGLTAGASVEGLRITWYDDGRDTKITLGGVGVEFEVPDVLRFQGAVSYREIEVDGEVVHRFDGDITLDLMALDLQLDATLVIGSARGDAGSYTFFAIYLGVELPTGIPLWSTGLGLYGIAGLFALNMEPDKRPEEEWYGMGPGEGWFKRPEIGVADLRQKWVNRHQSFALGAGVTIGTLPDNGYIFSGKVLLVIVFPGPILLIEGKASLLQERSSLDEEPIFRALAVLDCRAGTFLVGIDAQYKYDEDEGRVIDIHGSAEMFFSLSDLSAWHLYLGQKEPREKRIRAEIISFIEANAYFMIDARQLALGAWIGFDKDWTYGPLRIVLEAWLEGNVLISWKPAFFHGDVWLHGGLEISIFGIGIGITADARFDCDVYDPYHILAEFRITLTLLFWDFDIGFTLEWGPEPVPPPLPLPLKEIAVGHPKVSTTWPLVRGQLLLPNYERDGFRQEPDADPATVAALPPDALALALPIVPIDCRPVLSFGRPMHDDILIGVNAQPPDPEWERIGDPEKDEGPAVVRYGLKEVALEKWAGAGGAAWILVARNSASLADEGPPQRWESVPNDPGVGVLYGSWAAMPSDDGATAAQTKLMLWSKTPFDHTRLAGSAYDEWFTDRFSGYPCLPPPPDQERWYDFQRLAPGLRLASPWMHPDEPELVWYWEPEAPAITTLDAPVSGRSRALCFPSGCEIVIHVPRAAKAVRIICVARPGRPDGTTPGPTGQQTTVVTGYDPRGHPADSMVGGGPGVSVLEVSNESITQVTISAERPLCIVAVHLTIGPAEGEVTLREEMERHLRGELARWYQAGDVLEPHTIYRLKVVTTIQARGEDELAYYSADLEQTEYSYFRTGGPPGLTALTLPVGASLEAARRTPSGDLITIDQQGELGAVAEADLEGLDPDRQLLVESGLNDLAPYVRQTIPATVPAPGEQPLLPRPVYRAYDVGVEFNEAYVDLMYRLEGRDLGIYLYNSNNRPVRDACGRLLILTNQWGEAEQRILTASDQRWITVVNASDCAVLDPEVIPRAKALTSATAGQVLEPDTRYEARLIPLLLHEDFAALQNGTASGPDGALGGWRVCDEGTRSAPSLWEVHGHATLRGETASVAGAVVTLLGAAEDLSLLDPAADVLLLSGDTARTPGLYHIVAFDAVAKTITVDGEPALSGATSAWEIPGWHMIAQRTNIWGGSAADEADPLKPGTMLLRANTPTLPDAHPDQPSQWTDYRLSVLLRTQSPEDDAIGVVFRHRQAGGRRSYYRFSMDRQRRYRRLVAVTGETHRLLAEDAFVYSPDQDYLITVEAVGPSLRIYQDAVLIFDVVEDSLSQGGVGLYCWANREARFSDVRVDDYRQDAPVVYRFSFTTSRFTDLFHHLHSYQDATWLESLDEGAAPSEATIAALLAEAVPMDSPAAAAPPSPEEARAYDALATALLGPASLQNPPQLDITRVLQPDMDPARKGLALLVTSPEPIDWARTTLELFRTSRWVPMPAPPGAVKLTDVTLGTSRPSEETVTLLLREATDLTGHRIEYCQLPGPISEPSDEPVLLVDDFDEERGIVVRFEEERGVLVSSAPEHGASLADVARSAPSGPRGRIAEPRIGPGGAVLDPGVLAANSLPRRSQTRWVGQWRIVDEGRIQGPSVWRATGGALMQTSNIHGGSVAASAPAKPGTFAVAGDRSWTDYRLSVDMRSDDNDAIGLMVRVVDDDNYYRLSLDAERGYRRLIKKERGVVTTLWEDAGGFTVGQPLTLTLEAVGSHLTGHVGPVRLFDVHDSAHAAGQVGLYCWGNTGARFERVEVRRPPRESWALLRDRFAQKDMAAWTIVDAGAEDDVQSAPSDWRVEEGALHQRGNIWTPPNDGATLSKRGSHAIAGDPAWTDVVLTARLRSLDDDALGVLFRYTDERHYYRFSMDRQRGYRRLVKNVGGVFQQLWESDTGYERDRSYELTIAAVGETLRGYLDGIPLFVVQDGDLRSGCVGLYCWANEDAWFSDVSVYPPHVLAHDWLLGDAFDAREPGRWTIVDESEHDGPSRWEITAGELRQTSNVAGGAVEREAPEKPGTYALTGATTWSDYRISVRLRSDDNDAIGVAIRYQDVDNYYRFSMDRERRYRRLIKKVAGVVTVLWEDDARYVIGREYVVTLECVGQRLRGYLDGCPLFDVTDAEPSTGRIGLYCWANTGARFSEVQIAAPAWRTYYRFERETPLPAGTRVRVCAGNELDLPTVETGVAHRFIAALDETGRLRLSPEGVDLRLSGPGGTGHARRFLPEEAYAPVECRLLRKADGTGFFLVAMPLEAGQHRLTVTYRRDNREADPNSQVLSEAGNREAEHVTIDIPWQAV